MKVTGPLSKKRARSLVTRHLEVDGSAALFAADKAVACFSRYVGAGVCRTLVNLDSAGEIPGLERQAFTGSCTAPSRGLTCCERKDISMLRSRSINDFHRSLDTFASRYFRRARFAQRLDGPYALGRTPDIPAFERPRVGELCGSGRCGEKDRRTYKCKPDTHAFPFLFPAPRPLCPVRECGSSRKKPRVAGLCS